LKDYIQFLYRSNGDEPNWGFVIKQVEYYKTENDWKYMGMLLALKYYIEIDEKKFDTQYGLGGIIPKYYEIAKRHFIKIKELKREVKDLVIDDTVRVVKVNIGNNRGKYKVKELE